MPDEYVVTAVDAAVAAGAMLGLPTEHPDLLSIRANMLVRPSSVVGRGPASSRLTRPDAARRPDTDVAMAGFRSAAGVPVAPPGTDPPAGPTW